ncbi:hypothetical protein HMPREF0653_01830 [Prevotella disiens JCM 6334 = ATCC 29426]|uniref:Uncharacterized protein n=1 Tax=Prevotella disiens JCM 6334 = ATCC 29426 TaxID=1235811 RepID=A0ABN0NQT9_9BACT|nr:hypothetical protein HMPREF0653_01830 [Prevotella disiens JCM 6334 = ATCC 29426]
MFFSSISIQISSWSANVLKFWQTEMKKKEKVWRCHKKVKTTP